MNEVLSDKLDNFLRALEKLTEAINEPGNPFYIDATIKRFELTFETAWKMLKKALYFEGYDCHSPRDCLKRAYQSEYLDNEEIWLSMLRDRNRSTHLYSEADATLICTNIRDNYYPVLKKLEKTFRDKIITL